MENDNSYDAYLKSFNQGYIIQKYMPELGDELAKALKTDTLRAEGFREGREQVLSEKEKNKPKFLRKDRLNLFKENNEQIKDKGKDYLDRE